LSSSRQKLVARERGERLHVFLAQRGISRVHARRRRQHPVLRAERDDGFVQDDRPGLHPGLEGELVGQAGKARVEQAVEPLLAEVGQLREGDRDRVQPERERLGVPVPGRVEALRLAALGGQEHRAVGHGPQLPLQLAFERLEHVGHRAIELRRNPIGDRRLGAVVPVTTIEQFEEPPVNV